MEYTRTRGDAEAPHVGDPEWREDRHGWWLYREGSNRRKGVWKDCAKCGKPFLVVHSDVAKRKCCSRQCAALTASHARDEARKRRRGPLHPNWKGGRTQDTQGYIRVRVDDAYVLEHRHVMAQHLGRELFPAETVHHKNGDKTDNRLENLELRVGRHGRGATEAHCRTCTCFSG